MAQPSINLTRGVPPAEAFPTDDLARCSAAALRRDPAILLQYGKSPGYMPLREWLAERYQTTSDHVLVGNGSLEILSFITRSLMRSGDLALVEAPTYDRALTLLRRAGAEVACIPLEKDGLNLDTLERVVEDRAPALLYIVADFQNPMGVSTDLDRRQRLAELAREHGFWIVEDAPYRPLRYQGDDIPTIRSLAPERVLHMSSFSKVLAPGIRLGYLVGPRQAIDSAASWATDTYITPTLPTQGMVLEYCLQGLLEPNIERLKQLYRPRLQATLDALEEHLPTARWTQPEGGFFVGVTLPEGSDIETVLGRAPGVGLELTDGRAFYSDRQDGNRFLRIPFCGVRPEEIREGIERLASIV